MDANPSSPTQPGDTAAPDPGQVLLGSSAWPAPFSLVAGPSSSTELIKAHQSLIGGGGPVGPAAQPADPSAPAQPVGGSTTEDASSRHDAMADADKQGLLALSTGLGVQILGNFKANVLDRGRLAVAAAQEMRGGKANWTPLLLGVGAGLPLAGLGLMRLKEASSQGLTNLASTDGAIGVAELGAGAGLVALGAHKGLPNGLALLADIFRGPTTSTVPTVGGKWGLWGKTYRASNLIGSSIGTLTAVAAAASLFDGYSNGGPDGQSSPAGFINTRSGRAGIAYGLMAGVGFGYSGYAGLKGLKEGRSFIEASIGHEWLMKPSVRNVRYGIGLALGGLWALNQFTDVFSGLNHIGRDTSS